MVGEAALSDDKTYQAGAKSYRRVDDTGTLAGMGLGSDISVGRY